VLLFGLALMVGGVGVLVGFRSDFELGRLFPAGRARRLAVGLDAGLVRLGAGLRVVGAWAGAALGLRPSPPARRPAAPRAAGRAVGRASVPDDDTVVRRPDGPPPTPGGTVGRATLPRPRP
jgi:hypothetical protein